MTPFITDLSVWKVATSILKQRSKEIGVFFHFLSHHYTEEISPIESTASISKNGDCASEVGLISEGQVGSGGSPESR